MAVQRGLGLSVCTSILKLGALGSQWRMWPESPRGRHHLCLAPAPLPSFFKLLLRVLTPCASFWCMLWLVLPSETGMRAWNGTTMVWGVIVPWQREANGPSLIPGGQCCEPCFLPSSICPWAPLWASLSLSSQWGCQKLSLTGCD